MKKILSILFLFIGLQSFAQDSTKINQLTEVQIFGVHTTSLDPVSLTTLKTDSISNLYQGEDPFYILAKATPNIYSQSDNGSGNGYAYMRLRGLDQTRINYTLNGIPLNEMEDQGIYFSNMPGFYNNIGQFQIERGIGSSKYGTTSVAGSINMETKNLLQKDAGFDVGYGSNDTKRLNIGFSSGLLDKGFAFSTRASVFGTSGFKQNSGNRGIHGFYQFGYFGKKNIFKVYGFSGGSQNQMAYVAPTMSQIDTNYRVNNNISSEKDTFSQHFIALNWVNFSKENLTFNSSVYFNNIYGNYSVNNWGLMGVKSYQTGLMSNIVYSFNGHTINTGINYNYYQREHHGPSYDENWNYIGQYSNLGRKQDFILYTKANFLIGNGVHLFGDLQYRLVDFNYQNSNLINNFVNPKIGIKWIDSNTDRYLDVYWSVAYTHREPTRSDMFGGNDNPNIKTDLINLSPEKVTDLEIGTNFKYKGFNLSSNYYMMYFTNEYVSTGYINEIGIMVKKTYPHSVRTGLELETSYKNSGFTIGTNLGASYNQVYDSSGIGNTPYASPNLTMNNFVSYEYKYFMIGLNGQYNSKMYLDNTETLSTKQNYILSSFVGVKYKMVSLITNLNNITNQKYYIPAGVSGGQGTYYVGALFNYSLTLKVRF